jgi:uncharacterized protein DUF4136
MMRTLYFALISAVFLIGAGHSLYGDEVKTDYDHAVDFSQYHTYSWGQIKTSNPLYVDRIKQAVDQQLAEKGWQLVQSGGNAKIFAVGNVHNQQEVQTLYDNMGPGWGAGWGWGSWGWGPGAGFGESTSTTINQPVGHLVIDIFDGESKKLLFRGVSSGDISNNAEKNTKNLDNDIKKIFKDFPPKAK